MPHRRVRMGLSALLFLSCGLLSSLACPCAAAIKVWVGTTGNWTTSANWSPSGAPNDADDTFLVSSDSLNRTITFNDTSPILRVYRSVRLDSTGAGLLTLQQTDPNTTINADFLYVGNAVRGEYNLAAGGGFFTTSEVNAQGSLNIDFGAILLSNTFTQNGGSIQSNGAFNVSGNYIYNAGAFSGWVTTGNFIQNGSNFGGSVIVNNQLTLNPASSTISGSVWNHGPLTLPAGRSLTIGAEYFQHGSTFAQSGDLSVATTTLVGGGATWTQLAGTHTAREMIIGVDGPGSYFIGPGATLDLDGMSIAVGGDGNFTQTGGVVTTGGAFIRGGIDLVPSRMNWHMSGGQLTHTGQFIVGTRDAIYGIYTQTGGNATVRILHVNVDATTTASVNISGGAFRAELDSTSHGAINVSGGSAEFLEQLNGSGDVSVTGNGIMSAARVRQNSLFVGNTGVMRITAPANGVPNTNRVKSLVLQETGPTVNGTLDLTNNHLVIDYTGASPLPAIKRYLTSGYAGGNWNGTGIRSTGASQRALGYAEASDVLGPTGGVFTDVFADATSIIIRYTRYGDANLDGSVGLEDFNRLASNFNTSGKNWAQGNFNYDAAGLVGLDDFNLLAGNFNLSAGPDGVVDPEDWASLASAVPEPTCVFVVFGSFVLLYSRSRKRRLG